MILIRNVRLATEGRPAQHLISRNGVAIGLLEKYRNTAYEIHPWKAFFYVRPPGLNVREEYVKTEYLGAFYKSEGGKRAAVQAIIKRATSTV